MGWFDIVWSVKGLVLIFLVNTGSGNVLVSVQCQPITWTNIELSNMEYGRWIGTVPCRWLHDHGHAVTRRVQCQPICHTPFLTILNYCPLVPSVKFNQNMGIFFQGNVLEMPSANCVSLCPSLNVLTCANWLLFDRVLCLECHHRGI